MLHDAVIFSVGFIIGGFLGVLTTALLVAASESYEDRDPDLDMPP